MTEFYNDYILSITIGIQEKSENIVQGFCGLECIVRMCVVGGVIKVGDSDGA